MVRISRKRTVISFSLVVVVLIAIYGSGVFTRKKAEAGPTSPHGAGAKSIMYVETQVLAPAPIDRAIIATGSILANEELDMKSEIPGRVVALNFTEGRPVQQGALLVKLNDADLKASLKKAQAQLKLAQSEEERARKLSDGKLVSDEQYETIRNNVLTAQADIENIQSNIAKTEIHAPFSGIVGLRSISPGSIITTSTSIAKIQQLDPVKLEFNIPEKYAKDVHVGTAIHFTVVGSDRVYTGFVYAVEPKINVDTRTLTVRAMSPNKDRSLLPGNFAKISITLETKKDALAVPTTSIVPVLNGQKVYVVNNGHAVSRPIEVGIRTDSTVEVLSGLASGDTVVTTGLLQIRDGAAVSTR